MGFLGIVALFILLAVGVHIGVALGLVGIIGSALIVGFEGSVYSSVSSMYHKIASFELITIPLFVLMGYLASGGGISKKTFEALNAWVGRIRGGLGISTVCSCAAFGAVCGSSMVTAAVFARLLRPEMRKHGYDKKVAYGICASGGMIGMLIPPSILMVGLRCFGWGIDGEAPDSGDNTRVAPHRALQRNDSGDKLAPAPPNSPRAERRAHHLG